MLTYLTDVRGERVVILQVVPGGNTGADESGERTGIRLIRPGRVLS